MTGPDRPLAMRAADADRQAVADRLRSALEEGRLDLLEYDDRLGRAYGAVTYGELDELVADLPPVPHPPSVLPAVAMSGRARRGGALVVLWTVWLAVLGINLTVWFLVSLGNGTPDYFWPMWLCVPGAVLTVVSLGVRTVRGTLGR